MWPRRRRQLCLLQVNPEIEISTLEFAHKHIKNDSNNNNNNNIVDQQTAKSTTATVSTATVVAQSKSSNKSYKMQQQGNVMTSASLGAQQKQQQQQHLQPKQQQQHKHQQNNNSTTIALPKASHANTSEEIAGGVQDTIYLCNFRVSVDGDWLCLKELQDLDIGQQHSGTGGTSTSNVYGVQRGSGGTQFGQKNKRYSGMSNGLDDNGILTVRNLLGRRFNDAPEHVHKTSSSSSLSHLLTAQHAHADNNHGLIGVFGVGGTGEWSNHRRLLFFNLFPLQYSHTHMYILACISTLASVNSSFIDSAVLFSLFFFPVVQFVFAWKTLHLAFLHYKYYVYCLPSLLLTYTPN
uniref:Protein RUFY3 n=1 Tax=Ceratitis capitata TaxID=7213 RepID=W8BD54_CERCA